VVPAEVRVEAAPVKACASQRRAMSVVLSMMSVIGDGIEDGDEETRTENRERVELSCGSREMWRRRG
jgi:hypothetical protein